MTVPRYGYQITTTIGTNEQIAINVRISRTATNVTNVIIFFIVYCLFFTAHNFFLISAGSYIQLQFECMFFVTKLLQLIQMYKLP